MGAYNLSIRLLPEPIRTLAFGSISGTYAGIGTALANPCRLFILQNESDVGILFSFDGINDHIFLPSGGQLIMDVTTNHGVSNGFFVAEGTRFYAKESSGGPTTGAVYLSVFYGAGVTV